jgi:hypothetical protein
MDNPEIQAHEDVSLIIINHIPSLEITKNFKKNQSKKTNKQAKNKKAKQTTKQPNKKR